MRRTKAPARRPGQPYNRAASASWQNQQRFLSFLFFQQLIHSRSTYWVPLCAGSAVGAGDVAVSVAGKDPVLRN